MLRSIPARKRVKAIRQIYLEKRDLIERMNRIRGTEAQSDEGKKAVNELIDALSAHSSPRE